MSCHACYALRLRGTQDEFGPWSSAPVRTRGDTWIRSITPSRTSRTVKIITVTAWFKIQTYVYPAAFAEDTWIPRSARPQNSTYLHVAPPNISAPQARCQLVFQLQQEFDGNIDYERHRLQSRATAHARVRVCHPPERETYDGERGQRARSPRGLLWGGGLVPR